MTDESRITNPESLQAVLAAEIRQGGPLSVAAFMDLALYHPGLGYYARAGQRSGRAGDFFTSVDVGPLFGRLLAEQFADMFGVIESRIPNPDSQAPDESRIPNPESLTTGESRIPNPEPPTTGESRIPNPESLTTGESPIPNPESLASIDLVEAGAGNGRLSADVLRALRDRHPDLYRRVRLHLVDASAAARAAQAAALGEFAGRLTSSGSELPPTFTGVLFANELLDAMPVHQVVMRDEGLREVFVDGGAGGPERSALRVVEREPSTPALQAYLDAAGVALEPGARAEIGLAAVRWMRDAARRLARGFIVLVDYGHEARELYSAAHAGGTLTSFTRHTMAGSDAGRPQWLLEPGERDLTAHVDFSSIRAAAEAEGCVALGFLDQTYFLMGIVEGRGIGSLDPAQARALKTLIMPGGLGSTMKVLVLGKNVGRPRPMGCSGRMRIT